jgi:uncharacterized protein (TIGR03067 family)
MTKVVLLAVTMVLLVGADAKEDDIKKEIGKLKGTWHLSMLDDGHGLEAPTTEDVKGITLVVTDTLVETRRDGKVAKKLTYKIDPTKNPKTIDVTPEAKQAEAGLGIYSLEDDELKLVITGDFKPSQRPTEFKGNAMARLLYTIWKRENK